MTIFALYKKAKYSIAVVTVSFYIATESKKERFIAAISNEEWHNY